MNNRIITAAIVSALSAVAHSNTANAAMSSNASLNFDPGVYSCINNTGTPPNSCYYGTQVLSGSYFGLDYFGDGDIAVNERTALERGTEGLHVNSTQITAGAIDSTWSILGSPGNHISISDTTLLSDNGSGTATLDFSGWGFTWNGIPFITMGGGEQDCGTASDALCAGTDGFDNAYNHSGIFDHGTSIANITCGVDCSFNDTFTLSYFATVPYDDPSGFGGVSYTLFLTGNVSAVPVPAAVWLFGSGLLGLFGAARRRK